MMMIPSETLRAWLEEGYPVTILDVRPSAEYAEWSIPGSLHIDAYDALKAHDPEALSGLMLPTDQPIVTVCGAGKTSQIAAEQLAARGFQVSSLDGGMKAWSLAWNTAEVPFPDSEVRVLQVRRTGKGCLSYLIGDGENAIVIDASLDSQVYLDLAAHQGWRITSVLETHIHADHLSRSAQLAKQSGATLCLPDQQRVSFPATLLRNGDILERGKIRLTAIHTPGHTAESTCYLLEEQVLFTGDTLFPSGVGRPDLDASPVEAAARAEALYHSLKTLLALSASTLVLAGHTSTPVPFDGVPMMTTLAEVEEQVALLHVSRSDFVQTLLERLPATPPNYRQIVTLNEQGRLPDGPVTELEAGANRCAIS
jgi:glyoxylase-like metal-dependent hydrolase (beta-lactamase superfamily II)/rhodanese-related sulfurtransferase